MTPLREIKFEDHKRFFELVGGMYVYAMDTDGGSALSIEEMYQHFRSRLMEEMGVTEQ